MTLRLALTLGVLLLVAGGCGDRSAGGPTTSAVVPGDATPSADARGVVLTFDGTDPLEPTSAVPGVRVQRLGGAPVRTQPGGDGTRALTFPSYVGGRPEERLVLLVAGGSPTAAGVASGLSFGADVQLDAGRTSGAQDNGDNIVQRGLYSDDDQFKLQVDHRVPTCSVRTPRGRSTLALGVTLDDGWWRLRCDYDGVELHGSAVPMGGGAAHDVSEPARLGALSFAPGTAVSVGGKVASDGTLVQTQPDQLNGALDNVLVSPAP